MRCWRVCIGFGAHLFFSPWVSVYRHQLPLNTEELLGQLESRFFVSRSAKSWVDRWFAVSRPIRWSRVHTSGTPVVTIRGDRNKRCGSRAGMVTAAKPLRLPADLDRKHTGLPAREKEDAPIRTRHTVRHSNRTTHKHTHTHTIPQTNTFTCSYTDRLVYKTAK